MVCACDEPGRHRTVESEQALHGVSGDDTFCTDAGDADRGDNDGNADLHLEYGGRCNKLPDLDSGLDEPQCGDLYGMVYDNRGRVCIGERNVFDNAGDNPAGCQLQLVHKGEEHSWGEFLELRDDFYEAVILIMQFSNKRRQFDRIYHFMTRLFGYFRYPRSSHGDRGHRGLQ